MFSAVTYRRENGEGVSDVDNVGIVVGDASEHHGVPHGKVVKLAQGSRHVVGGCGSHDVHRSYVVGVRRGPEAGVGVHR